MSNNYWYIDGQFDAECSVCIRDLRTDELIVEVEPFLEDWTEEEIARVRLMAQAPRLLEALKGETQRSSNVLCVGALIEQCPCERCIRRRSLDAIAAATSTAGDRPHA